MFPSGLLLAILCAGTAGAAGPVYAAANLVNASNYTSGPFAPNSVISLFGTGLARSTVALTAADISGGSLPTEMNFVRVYVENEPAPLLFVSEGQINFLIPSLASLSPVHIRVVSQGVTGPEITVNLVNCAPALFALAGGYTIATSAQGKLLTPDAPAHPGDTIVIYLTGLGRTSAQAFPGEIPRSANPILALASLRVTIGPVAVAPALIKYAGVTPGSGGLYQINLIVPEGVGIDPELKVTGDVTSGGLKLAIH
jgi:uncharacterized protein (TIGR03437 family)